MKSYESAWRCIESHNWNGKRVNFEILIFFREILRKRLNMRRIPHLNWEKSELWNFNIFSWNLIKALKNALNPTSEPGKEWTLKFQYFFIKSYEMAWTCIESHIWTMKIVNFEISILFHEILCKRLKMHWIQHLNWDKSEIWNFNIFSWNLMKALENALNLKSELGKE